MVEAFPEDTAPRYLLRDRDKIYGYDFRERIQGMGMEEVLSAPASPWQRAYLERLIGSIRHDCLDHVIVLGEGHLRRILQSYLEYYQGSRTHLGLGKDTPEPRPFSRRKWERSWPCLRWVVFTIVTNAGRRSTKTRGLNHEARRSSGIDGEPSLSPELRKDSPKPSGNLLRNRDPEVRQLRCALQVSEVWSAQS